MVATLDLTCKKCGHVWEYKGGQEFFTRCPACKNRVRFKFKRGYRPPHQSKFNDDIGETDKAYIAGFFDGEGCVQINKIRDDDCIRPRHYLSIHFANNNRGVLEYIRNVLGCGNIQQGTPHIGWRVHWQLNILSRLAAKTLEVILPYLKIKGAEAQIALEFQTLIKDGKHSGSSQYTLTDDDYARREGLRNRLMGLK